MGKHEQERSAPNRSADANMTQRAPDPFPIFQQTAPKLRPTQALLCNQDEDERLFRQAALLSNQCETRVCFFSKSPSRRPIRTVKN
jgi:hypothetical protein